ncbi:sinapyl alcohol dehydrogenase [Aureococcus anophagefferens]|nr:sinapyl alcohol dehydrogenase [Aureococcus anophagefferens]
MLETLLGDGAACGSVMVTASHLPPEYNGLKFFSKALGRGLNKREVKEVMAAAEAAVEAGARPDTSYAAPNAKDAWRAAAGFGNDEVAGFMDPYVAKLRRTIIDVAGGGDAKPLAGFKICVNAGNGAGGFFATEDKAHVAATADAVAASGADVGVMLDTDVDRCGLIDGARAPEPVHQNRLARGGVHDRYKMGYRNVIDRAADTKPEPALLAIETSGHSAWKDNAFVDDGCYTAAKLLGRLARFRREEARPDAGLLDVLGDGLAEPAESIKVKMKVASLAAVPAAEEALCGALRAAAGAVDAWAVEPVNHDGLRCSIGNDWIIASLHEPLVSVQLESDVAGGTAAICKTLLDFMGDCEAAGVDVAPLKDVAAKAGDPGEPPRRRPTADEPPPPPGRPTAPPQGRRHRRAAAAAGAADDAAKANGTASAPPPERRRAAGGPKPSAAAASRGETIARAHRGRRRPGGLAPGDRQTIRLPTPSQAAALRGAALEALVTDGDAPPLLAVLPTVAAGPAEPLDARTTAWSRVAALCAVRDVRTTGKRTGGVQLDIKSAAPRSSASVKSLEMLAGADDAGLVAAVEGSAVLEDAWVDELGLAPVHAVKRYRPLADLCCRTHEKIREKLRGTDLVTLAADCPSWTTPRGRGRRRVSASSESLAARRRAGGLGPAVDARCLACDDTMCAFRPLVIQRRAVGPKDILIQIKFCGVCASDLWTARSGQSVGCRTASPVPGHEIAGVVAAVGADVEAFAVGDRVGVMTYASPDRHGRCGGSTPQTAGGYADRVVVQERFAIAIPAALPLEAAGPLMCAGTTAYAPLKRYGAKKGTRVGVVGLGGVGAMAVKLAKALGCEVTAISRSKKAATACKFGADRAAVLEAAALDLVIDTVPVAHDLAAVRALLDPARGKLVLLGVHPQSFAANYVDKLLGGTAPVTMSWIGGTACVREVVDLCARRRIAPRSSRAVSELPAVLEAIDAGNDAGRRVLDLATLPARSRPAFAGGEEIVFGSSCCGAMARMA